MPPLSGTGRSEKLFMGSRLAESGNVLETSSRQKAASGSKGFFTTRQLAESLGMSESSVKRWANEGKIGVVRTVGGHRRIPFDEALKFIRESGLCVIKPEILGLDYYTTPHKAGTEIEEVSKELHEALVVGDADTARQLILAEFYSGRSIAEISDGPVSYALNEIGTTWKRNEEDGIFIEHRAMDICFDIFRRLQTLLDPKTDRKLLAIGCAPNRDVYALPTLIASIVLLETGYTSVNLGAVTPLRILRRAAEEHQPNMLWIAMNALPEENPHDPIVDEIRELSESVKQWDAHIVLGGRGVPDSFRHAEWQSIRYMETMQQLADFSREQALAE